MLTKVNVDKPEDYIFFLPSGTIASTAPPPRESTAPGATVGEFDETRSNVKCDHIGVGEEHGFVPGRLARVLCSLFVLAGTINLSGGYVVVRVYLTDSICRRLLLTD